MDIISNVQKAVKTTIKALEGVSGTAKSDEQPWKPAVVKGTIYGDKITHFKRPIKTNSRGTNCKRQKTDQQEEWALKNFFKTGEAICRFCFRLASDMKGVFFVIVNDRIRSIYLELTGKELLVNGMPGLLCPECDQNLTSAVETRRRIIEAEGKLLEHSKKPEKEVRRRKRRVVATSKSPESPGRTTDEKGNILEPEIHIKDELMDDFDPQNASNGVESEEDFRKMEGFSLIVDKNGEMSLSCTVCDLSFETPEEQKTHFTEEHTYEPKEPAMTPDAFHCTTCNTILSSIKSLKIHKLALHGDSEVTCDQCGLMLESRLIDGHMRMEHAGAKYVCCLCSQGFGEVLVIRQHILTNHNPGKPFKCAHCDLAFEEKVYRRMHVNEKHKIQADWGCLHCGLKCGSKAALKEHLAECVKVIEEETGMKIKMETKTCEICKDIFMNRNDLANHKLRMHTSKYDCHLCASKFTIKKKFEAHVARHKDVPRPFKCEQCDASYGKPAHLQSHIIRTHTKNFKYHCQYCLKGFILVGEKVAHERTHTGEKPVGCSMCEKRFARQEQLRRHIKRTHSRRLMFRCLWCQRNLSDSRKLFDHVNKFHPDEYNSDVDLDSWSYEVKPEIPNCPIPGRPLNYKSKSEVKPDEDSS